VTGIDGEGNDVSNRIPTEFQTPNAAGGAWGGDLGRSASASAMCNVQCAMCDVQSLRKHPSLSCRERESMHVWYVSDD